MREVVYQDRNGYLRRVLLRDEDNDDMAAYGLPVGPPDIELIDWEAIKKQVNNFFVQSKINTRMDLQRTHGLEAVASIFKREVDRVFREKATEDKNRRPS